VPHKESRAATALRTNACFVEYSALLRSAIGTQGCRSSHSPFGDCHESSWSLKPSVSAVGSPLLTACGGSGYDNGQPHLALWKKMVQRRPGYAVAHNDGETGAAVDVISGREWKPPKADTRRTAYAGPLTILKLP
jgi:hypothetical protein